MYAQFGHIRVVTLPDWTLVDGNVTSGQVIAFYISKYYFISYSIG
jgi:hypothetical protein